jgi:hypothetical protein
MRMRAVFRAFGDVRTAGALAVLFILALGSSNAWAQKLDVTVRVSDLSEPSGSMNVSIYSGSARVCDVHGQNKICALPPGTYRFLTPLGHGDYGTATISGSPLSITSVTGALTVTGNTIGFNRQQLAPVRIQASMLSAPAKYAQVIVYGVSFYIYGTDPVLFLPPTVGSSPYVVQLAGSQGTFGTFRVTSELTVSDVTGVLTLSGNTLQFDLSQLASVQVQASVLSAPAGLVAVAIQGTMNYIYGNTPTIYLPPNDPGKVYDVIFPGEQASYGTFQISNTLELTSLTGALTPLTDAQGAVLGITFDTSPEKLAHVTVDWRPLSEPAGHVPVQIRGVSSINFLYAGPEPVLYLPPNFPGRSYELILVNDTASYGKFTITGSPPMVTASTDYIIRSVSGGVNEISFNLCALFNVHVQSTGKLWNVAGTAVNSRESRILRLPGNRTGGPPYRLFQESPGGFTEVGTFLLQFPRSLTATPAPGQTMPTVTLTD